MGYAGPDEPRLAQQRVKGYGDEQDFKVVQDPARKACDTRMSAASSLGNPKRNQSGA